MNGKTKKATRENKIFSWIKNYSYSIITILLLIVIWEFAVKFFDIKDFYSQPLRWFGRKS